MMHGKIGCNIAARVKTQAIASHATSSKPVNEVARMAILWHSANHHPRLRERLQKTRPQGNGGRSDFAEPVEAAEGKVAVA